MNLKVEFYKDGKLHHTKKWELDLDTAKQHASLMAKPYGANSARVLDRGGKEVFSYTVPEDPIRS